MSSYSSTNFFKEKKPLEYFLYPTLSVVLAVLIVVPVYRFLQRRRLRRGQGVGLDWNDDVEEETSKLVQPRMYEVYLDSEKIGRQVDWNDIMPIASNVNVHVGDAELAPSHPATQRQPWLPFNGIKSAILSGLELLSLYNRRAERELRARNSDRDDLAVGSDIPEPPLDPSLPRELVTGVMILMPSVHRTSHGKQESWEEEQLPDVAIGLNDKEWKGRIDVKIHGVKLFPDEYLAATPASAWIRRLQYLAEYGRNARQVVDHVHFHVIPKLSASQEEGLVVGWPAKKAESDDLKAYEEELKPKLQSFNVVSIRYVEDVLNGKTF